MFQKAHMADDVASTSVSLRVRNGDALRIIGEDSESGDEQTWFAVAKQDVDASKHETVDVEYITPRSPNDPVWQFEGVLHTCPLAAVMQVEPVDEDRGPQYAWAELGFRMLDGSTMVREDEDRDVPVGDAAFELASDSDDDEGSLKDFIVEDKDTPRFTFAQGAFARETHAAVRGFDAWQPPPGSRLAEWQRGIRQLEARAAALDDERQFEAGHTAVDYNRPCTPKPTTTS